MAGESQQTPDSAPDPSVYTQEAIARAAKANRDYMDGQYAVMRQRMDDRDEAVKVLNETVTRVPTDVQKAVGHLHELTDERFGSAKERADADVRLTMEKFQSVQTQFRERDERAARESRDNKIAVDAAFAAQEKLAVQQNEGNQVAIKKSENSTNETINKNQESAAAANKALSEKFDDLKDRVNRMESIRVGGQEAVAEKRQASGAVYAAVGFGISILLALIVIVGVIAAGGNP